MSAQGKLRRILRELQEENKKLKEEIAYLKFELGELKDKIYKKKSGKDDPPPPAEAPSKKRGAPFGHLGWFRKKPPTIDKIVEVTLDRCPHCGKTDLKECVDPKVHLQEDIVFPKVEVTSYRKRRYYCRACKKTVCGLGEGEIPGSFIGPLAKSVAAYFKYHVKVSDRDIQKIFWSLFGLKMTPSAVPGFRNQMRRRLLPVYRGLLEKIKSSRLLHVDETGWRMDGKNHWLWSFSNKKVSVCHIDKSRGQGVIETVLGQKYKGILVSDFLSAYNRIETKAKQRCLVHLLRDLKKVRECLSDDRSVQRFSKRLEEIIQSAMKLAHQRDKNTVSKAGFERSRFKLEEALKDLKYQDPKHKILGRFTKRLERHKGEILTFLYHKGIDPSNNHAERQIRPNVLLRKITFGNRSEKGVQNHNILMSIVQTAKLTGADPLKRLKELLLASTRPRSLAALSPP